MENALSTILFLLAPIGSLLVAYVFFAKSGGGKAHFLHIFSISYLAVLALREINEIIAASLVSWVVIIAILFVLLLYINDLKNLYPKIGIFSHHHHTEFSYVLAGLFILHSFIDGLLFGSSELIQSGLTLHRAIDGFVIFGLIAGEHFSLRKIKPINFALIIAFICAPLLGLFLPEIIKANFWVVIKNISMFILATLSIIDLRFEISHGHIDKKKTLIIIALAHILGLSIGH